MLVMVGLKDSSWVMVIWHATIISYMISLGMTELRGNRENVDHG